MNKDDEFVKYILDNQHCFYRLAYCYAHNSQDAQDIVQNSIVRAFENLHTLRNRKSYRSWFYRILVNESLSYVSRHNREIPYEAGEIFENSYFESQYEPADELLSHVFQLPADIRTVIVLHVYEDLTLKEVSKVTQAPLSTVKSRYYSGLEQLRRRLDSRQ